MSNASHIAMVAALMGDPARAKMLTLLMDGRALTMSELAEGAGITLPTASSHLSKLTDGGLLDAARQGRHRYFKLSGIEVAAGLEMLMGLAVRPSIKPVRTGPKDQALRHARVCYDHLAGETAVAFYNACLNKGWISRTEPPMLTPDGQAFFQSLGIDVEELERLKRPLCRNCLDWSERRQHLGGSLGAAFLNMLFARKWARRAQGRGIEFSPAGRAQMQRSIQP